MATLVTPDTLRRWSHRLIAQKVDGSMHPSQLGRPHVTLMLVHIDATIGHGWSPVCDTDHVEPVWRSLLPRQGDQPLPSHLSATCPTCACRCDRRRSTRLHSP